MSRRRPARILVVEDEAIVARDIQTTLADNGYEIMETAGSCDEAVQRAAERSPDLVLMDIRIQGQLDGIEAAEILRRQFKVPVVFLTAYADDTTLERAKRAQPYGYLVKPIKSHELRSAVEVALHKHETDVRLRERERWFSTTLRSIGDAVISTDLEARVTFMNAVAETLTGWRTEEAMGRPLDEVLQLAHEESHEPVENPIRRALREKTVARLGERISLRGKDGAERPIDDIAAPIMDEGDVLGAVMVFRDITEQRRLQRQIELADRLTSVGTMAAGVAHEIHEPLAAILSNVQFVADQLNSHRAELRALLSDEAYASLFKQIDDIHRALGDAETGAHRVTNIVSELRTFARPPTNKERPVDLRRVLSWAAEVVAPEIRSRAALAMEIGTVPPVYADEGRLGQVFINLLLNAAQAIPPGNVRANEVRVTGRTLADGRAEVEVRDTGSGIPPELMARIFDPFFTTRPIVSGTGLGLSICHGIVRSLGGEIQVQSEVGKGSRFRVLLPPATTELRIALPSAAPVPAPPEGARPASAARAVAAPAPPAAAGGGTPPPAPITVSRHGNVLVIDDEPVVASTIRSTLEPDHRVTCVKSVREANALIDRGERFDVILCDLMLPDINGMDFYDDLLRTRPDVARQVIFISGGAFTPRAVEFVASVSNRCLEKPFTAHALRAAVRQTLFGG